MAVAATLLTVPILVSIGELIPKTIGIKLRLSALGAHRLGPDVWPDVDLGRAALDYPARCLRPCCSCSASACATARPARAERKQFRTLVDLGSAEGEIQRTEAQLIHNVLDFGDLTVREVMTPAQKVFSLPYDLPLGRAIEAVTRQRYSRVPVHRGRRDNIVGILFAKDMVGVAANERSQKLADLCIRRCSCRVAPRPSACSASSSVARRTWRWSSMNTVAWPVS